MALQGNYPSENNDHIAINSFRYAMKTSPLFWVLVIITVVILLYGFWDGIVSMVKRWYDKEEYGYAFFIPFISTYLIWQRRDQLIKQEFSPSWVGVLIILVAGLFFFMGKIAATYTLVQYALIISIWGFAYALLGRQAFKLVIGPLLLLFFIVPLPAFVYNDISGKLQLLSSVLGVEVIRWFDISVFLEGNVIDLGDYKLQVVEACNGLRYLFPLMSLAFLAAYLYQVELWKRIVVFVSSIPITVLMNSFRIGVIGVLVNNWGQEQADGFLHYFEGWVIFMICFAILLFEMALLAKVGATQRRLKEVFGLDSPKPLPAGIEYRVRRVSVVHYAILLSFLLIAVSSFYVQVHDQFSPERQRFSNFPLQIGEWIGKQGKLEDIYLNSLKLDDYLINDFINPIGKSVNFYVAYYESQQTGSAAHSPRTCIPGGGWEIETLKRVEVPGLKIYGEQLFVNRLVIKRGDYKQLVYYWFQQRGRGITSEWLVKWYLFLDGLTKNRTDGALVRLTTSIGEEEEWVNGDERLVEFAGKVIPLLDNYIPD